MDVGVVLSRAAEGFRDTVAALEGAAWDAWTTCEMSVRDLILHVIAGNYFAVHLLDGASADEAGVAAVNRLGALDDVVTEVAASCDEQTQAFMTADRERRLHHPVGDIDFDTFVRYRLGDLVVHRWDIATAARLDATMDDDVAEELWRCIAPHLEDMRHMGSFGPGASGTLPPQAGVQQRILDAFGRRG